MISARKFTVTTSNRFLRSVLLVTILFISALSLLFIVPKDVSAFCWCTDPASDLCRCTTNLGNSGYCTDFFGVEVCCETSIERDSWDAIKSPVCGSSAEIAPYCAPLLRDPNHWMCYGGIFAQGKINIPVDSSGSITEAIGRIIWNGRPFGEIGDSWTSCGDNVFCCANSSGCSSAGVPPTFSLCPAQDGPFGGPGVEICNAAPGSLAGEGESRLWFSQTRLVNTLSTMAQTIFNPKGLNEMYEDTAFSKAATQNERDNETSGNIDNKGSLTSRVNRHQGADDSTVVVNTHSNNSSIIVGSAAPPPLSPYYEEYRDRACFLEETFTNPGDDLIGAKMRGEMLFTEQFTVPTKGRPLGCVDDGSTTSVPYPPPEDYEDPNCDPTDGTPCCNTACCSASCDVSGWNNPCVEIDPDAGGSCFELGKPNACPRTIDGQLRYFCCEVDESCHPPATVPVNCGTLPTVKLDVGGDANIFNKSPLLEAINDTILTGDDSLFNRFMPRNDGLIDVEELPTKTPFGLSASVIGFGSVNPGSFSTTYAEGKISAPEMYIPHLGSLYKHWLIDFQKAIKPLEFGEITVGTPGTTNPTQPIANPFDKLACPSGAGPPDPTSTGVLCQSNCRAVSDSTVLSTASGIGINGQYFLDVKDTYIDWAVNRWVARGGENSLAAECYNDVVVRSLNAGVNPVYSLAIWLQESDASNYDFNSVICDPNDGVNSIKDFGIFDFSIAGNFDAQISYFLQLPYDYMVNYPQCFTDGCDIGTFSLIYQQGITDNPTCTFNQGALDYATKTIDNMSKFSPGCLPKYPTDLSCPQ